MKEQSERPEKPQARTGVSGKSVLIAVICIAAAIMAILISIPQNAGTPQTDSPDATDILAPMPTEPGWTEEEPGYDPDVIAAPDPDTVSAGGVISYRGLYGDYTFGLKTQPESCKGIVLAPTYQARTGSTPRIGFFLHSQGCTEIYQQIPENMKYSEIDNTMYCDEDPIILFTENFGLQFPIMFKDEINFGVAWTLDELGGDLTGAEESWITLRSIDLRFGTVSDIIKLHFGRQEDVFSLLSAENAVETDPELIKMASSEIQMALCYQQKKLFPDGASVDKNDTSGHEILRWQYPVSEPTYTYDPDQYGICYFIQRLERPYGDRYIDVETGQETHYSYLEGLPELFGVTCNMTVPNSSFATLYMVPEVDPETGEQILVTVGYEPIARFADQYLDRA